MTSLIVGDIAEIKGLVFLLPRKATSAQKTLKQLCNHLHMYTMANHSHSTPYHSTKAHHHQPVHVPS